MGNSFWILFAALNNLKPLNLTIAEVNVFSYSLCETVCPLHYGVINRHWALDVTEKCLRVVWSHVLFPPRKCNTRCANLFFAPGNLQNRTWAPNWNRALKPTTEERPSGEGVIKSRNLRGLHMRVVPHSQCIHQCIFHSPNQAQFFSRLSISTSPLDRGQHLSTSALNQH